jgi:hypothetical protein
MPVSNPSYFPDQRGNGSVIGITAGQFATGANCFLGGTNAGRGATVADLIVIGNGSGAAGIVGVDLAGSVIVGVGAAPLITTGVGNAAPLTVVGSNNLALCNGHTDSLVVVGSGILNGATNGPPGTVTYSTSVFVGNNLFPLAKPQHAIASSVVMGFEIGTGGNGQDTEAENAVMIGARLFAGTAYSTPYSGIIIGTDIDQAGGAPDSGFEYGPNVIVGADIVTSNGPSGCVLIGLQQAYSGGATSECTDNVVIGAGNSYSGNRNTVIGNLAAVPHVAADASFGNVVIGSGAGTTLPVTINTALHVASQTGSAAPVKGLLYGLFGTGNLVLGNSDPTVDVTLLSDGTATNICKLLNGTAGAVNPTGGGYFYVAAGALHWKGSAGTDTVVAPA